MWKYSVCNHKHFKRQHTTLISHDSLCCMLNAVTISEVNTDIFRFLIQFWENCPYFWQSDQIMNQEGDIKDDGWHRFQFIHHNGWKVKLSALHCDSLPMQLWLYIAHQSITYIQKSYHTAFFKITCQENLNSTTMILLLQEYHALILHTS